MAELGLHCARGAVGEEAAGGSLSGGDAIVASGFDGSVLHRVFFFSFLLRERIPGVWFGALQTKKQEGGKRC